MSTDLNAFKEGQQKMWAMGDFPDLAKQIVHVAQRIVQAVGAGPGTELLDVATGSGNVAIAAAQAGAKVTGLDLTPELLEVARRRGAEAGLEIEWLQGDAEALPFADDSFEQGHLLLWCDLRAKSPDGRRRARAGGKARSDHRLHSVDARGPQRQDVRSHGLLHAPAPAGFPTGHAVGR